jgi:FAD/FMN-containing dehydrogenase
VLDDTTVRAFDGAFAGELIGPRDGRYEAARRVWNGMVDRSPAVIARCADDEDVVAALRFAREHGLPLAVRGGGHNVAGNAVCDGGVVIDLSAMKRIQVDAAAGTARAQPGVLLGELDRATQAFGLATPTGNVSMTGVAGLTLGGGLGWIARKYGPACDNLLAANVVTADGDRVRAGADANPDLLWGLRGGGGNFGVVTSFEYRLHPVGPQVIAGGVVHAFADAPEVLRFFADYVATAPDELSVVASTFRASPGLPVPPASGCCGRCAGSGGRSRTWSRRCPTQRCSQARMPAIRAGGRTTGSPTTSTRSATPRSPRSSSTRRG